MCIVVSEHCTDCGSHEVKVFRCLTKMATPSDNACRTEYAVNDDGPNKFICTYCLLNHNNKDVQVIEESRITNACKLRISALNVTGIESYVVIAG